MESIKLEDELDVVEVVVEVVRDDVEVVEVLDDVRGDSAAKKYTPENFWRSQLNSVKTAPGLAVVDHK